MSDITTLQNLEAAVQKAEKTVAVMEAQKKELEATLEEYGFDSMEELDSAIDGLQSMLNDESEKLRDRLNVLSEKMQELYVE